MKQPSFFRGEYKITVAPRAASAVLDFLTRFDIPYHGARGDETGFVFFLYPRYFKLYRKLRKTRRFAEEKRERLGLIAKILPYKKRPGLVIGGVLAVLLFCALSLFVWDIRISGNTTLKESEILEVLAANGVKIGTFLPTFDSEKAEKRVGLLLDGASFVSINKKGTVLYAVVKERLPDTEILDTVTPSNLIARMDGQLVSMEITGGVAAKKVGDIVKKGDLLASGIINSNALGYRPVRAIGKVEATVNLVYHIEIPEQTIKKVYTGREKTEKTVKIFGKTINLFIKNKIFAGKYDKIEEDKRISLFGKIKLPLFLRKTVYREYEELPYTMTDEELLQKANSLLQEQKEETLGDATVLSVETVTEKENGVLILQETVTCILDIAEEQKFENE